MSGNSNIWNNYVSILCVLFLLTDLLMCLFIFIICYILLAKLQKSFETKDDVFLPREGFCLHILACYTVIELTKESFCPTRAQLLLFHFHYPGVAVSALTQRWWALQATLQQPQWAGPEPRYLWCKVSPSWRTADPSLWFFCHFFQQLFFQ